MSIFAALSDIPLEKACGEFEGQSFSVLKEKLTELLVATLTPIREKMITLLKEPHYLDEILQKGAHKANDLASKNMGEIKEIVGLLRV